MSHQTIYQRLQESARQHPNATAYLFYGQSVSYRALLCRIERAAMGLSSIGIRSGDRVTICMPNTPQALECFYALNRLGAVANMVHPLSAPEEIAFYLRKSRSKAILILDTLYRKIKPFLPYECTVLVASIAEALPFPFRHLPFRSTSYLRWHDLTRKNVPLPPHRSRADALAVVLYSGGTTGKPKGVMLSSRNINALATQTIIASGLGSIAGKKVLSVLPIFHGFGLGIGIHTALAGGASCILVPRFRTDACARLLIRHKPQILLGVPTFFGALLSSKALQNADLSFLQGIFSGGDKLSSSLKCRMDIFLRRHCCSASIREGYGATECVAACCLTPAKNTHTGSVGRPLPNTHCQIVTPGTIFPCAPGQVGEICVSGPSVMLGYLDDPAETNQALQLHADGRLWLHTGDLGYLDADGFLYFKQRLKRLIVTAGYNIYPSELEEVLLRHPHVQQVCCIGVPDAYRGQQIRAYIVPSPDVPPSPALRLSLIHFCTQHLSKFALPRQWVFCTDLPKTQLGKVDYLALERESMV